jgi:polysaccharide export outer membrane protein
MKNLMKFVIAASAVLALLGLTLAAQAPPKAQTQAQPLSQQARDEFVKAYRIGPGDLLQINVFEVPELTQEVRVSEDGSITLPLLRRVVVEGLTQEGLVQKLTQLLQAGFVKNPQVTIFIKEYKSKQVAVIGAVANPGNFELVGRRNLLQMLSAAGGLTDAVGNQIYVLREGPDGGASTIPIDVRDLTVNGNPELNIPIEPGDVINVPIDREIRVFVMGRVTTPGPITAKLSEGLTLLQAIAGAGGVAQGAKQSAIMITRKNKAGQEIKIKVNLKDIIKGKKKDIPLQEGDVVYVPESFW